MRSFDDGLGDEIGSTFGSREYRGPRVDVDDFARSRNDVVTEDSAALQFAERYAGKLLYDHDVGAWFTWSGSHWRRETTGLAFEWARNLSRELGEDAPAKSRAVVAKTSFASGVERFSKSDRAFAVTSENWDSDAFLLGTPGGTIDLRTGTMRKAEPADRMTKIAAVAPAKNAACPRWKQFLIETTGGDVGMVRFLQQFAGYALTGDTREHALVFAHGSGGNGKSVFMNTVTRIAGDYAVTAAMETFVASNGDKHPTDLAMLRGARLVTASETEEGRAWAESRIKQITGGDPISARFMRQDFFTFKPAFKLFVIGNHKPVLRNVDDAARRRFNIVPFVLKPAKPDRDLEAKLRDEWPAILRWMIDGCLDWQAHGLVRPASVVEATNDYFSAQDLVGQFLEEECDVQPGNDWKKVTAGELFTAWVDFAKAAGEAPGSQKAFSEAVTKHGVERRKGSKGVRVFIGVRVRKPTERSEAA